MDRKIIQLYVTTILILVSCINVVTQSSCSRYNDADLNVVVILDEEVQSLCSESTQQKDENLRQEIYNITSACTSHGLKVFSECGLSRSNELEIYSRVLKPADENLNSSSAFCVKDDVQSTIVVSESNLTTPQSANFALVTVSPFQSTTHNVITISIDETYRIQSVFNKLVELDWDYISLIVTEEYYKVYSELIKSELSRTRVCTRSISGSPIIIYNHTNRNSQIHADTTGVVYIGDDQTGADLYRRWRKDRNIWVMTIHPSSINVDGPPLLMISSNSSKRQLIKSAVRTITENCGETLLEITPKLSKIKPTELKWTLKSANSIDSLISRSLCKTACSTYCSELLRRKQRYMYIHGDYILLITAPITEKTTGDQWICSQSVKKDRPNAWEMLPRSVHAQLALNLVNDNLRNHTRTDDKSYFQMGIVLVNTCYSGQRTNYILQQIFSGELRIESHDGIVLNPKKIVMILSDYSSNVAPQTHDYAVWNNLIQIGWGASTPLLDDQVLYPNFYRINPSDNHTITYMADLLTQLNEIEGNDIKRVNIFYSDNVYGRNALELKRRTEARGFEVSRIVSLNKKPESMSDEDWKNDDDFKASLEYLLDDATRVHLVYGDLEYYLGLLDELRNSEHSDIWQSSERIFIFDTSWGGNNEYKDTYRLITRGSLSIAVYLNFTCAETNFHKFFEKHPYNYNSSATENPWLNMIWSFKAQCKPRGEFYEDFPDDTGSCFNKNWGSTPGGFDAQEMWALMLMKSIFTASKAFQSYLIHTCDGMDTKKSCADELNKIKEKGELGKLKGHLNDVGLRNQCNDAMHGGLGADSQKVFKDQQANSWVIKIYQQQIDCHAPTPLSSYVQFSTCSSDRSTKPCQRNPNITKCEFYHGTNSCSNKGCIKDPGDTEKSLTTTSNPSIDANLKFYIVIGVLALVLFVIAAVIFVRKYLQIGASNKSAPDGPNADSASGKSIVVDNTYESAGSHNGPIGGARMNQAYVGSVNDIQIHYNVSSQHGEPSADLRLPDQDLPPTPSEVTSHGQQYDNGSA